MVWNPDNLFVGVHHPVGQGLFYSARTPASNFVYDCGSLQKIPLEAAVSGFRVPKAGNLGALCVSHLDADHVNGLDRLLSKCAPRTVFLPYLSTIERLRIAAKGRPEGIWYYQFLTNPARYLVSRGAGRVIYLRGGEPDYDGAKVPIPPEHPLRPPVEGDMKPPTPVEDSNGSSSPSVVKKVGGSPSIHGEPESELSEDSTPRTPVELSFHDGYWCLADNWLFRFYVNPQDTRVVARFQRKVESALNVRLNDPGAAAALLRSVVDYASRRKLVAIYRTLAPSLNETSLVLFHGPIARSIVLWSAMATSGFHRNGRHPPGLLACVGPCKPGQSVPWGELLTGDLPLRGRVGQLRAHFGSYLSTLGSVLLPHHGSRNNWDPSIMRLLPSRTVWTVSSGYRFRRNWEHPDRRVLDSVLRAHSRVLWANQYSSITEQFYCEPWS